MNKAISYISMLFFLVHFSSSAQDPFANKDIRIIKSDLITSQSNHSIIKDKDGFIWFAGAGLYKSDGINIIEVISSEDKRYLNTGLMSNLHIVDSILYMSSSDGIWKYNLNNADFDQFEWYYGNDTIQSNYHVESIVIEDNYMYLGRFQHEKCGVYKIDITTGQAEKIIASSCNLGIFRKQGDNYYTTNPLIRYNAKSKILDTINWKQHSTKYRDPVIRDIIEYKNKILIAGQKQAFTIIDNHTLKIDTTLFISEQNLKYSNDIRSIEHYSNDKYLITTIERGVGIVDMKTQKISFYDDEIDLNSSNYAYSTTVYDDFTLVSYNNQIGILTEIKSSEIPQFNSNLKKGTSTWVNGYYTFDSGNTLATTNEVGIIIKENKGKTIHTREGDNNNKVLYVANVSKVNENIIILNNSWRVYSFNINTFELKELYSIVELKKKTEYKDIEKFCCFEYYNDQLIISGKSFIIRGNINGDINSFIDISGEHVVTDSKINSDSTYLTLQNDTIYHIDHLGIKTVFEDKENKFRNGNWYFLTRIDEDKYFTYEYSGKYGGYIDYKNNTYTEILAHLDIGSSKFMQNYVDDEKNIFIMTSKGILHLDEIGNFINLYGPHNGVPKGNTFGINVKLSKEDSILYMTYDTSVISINTNLFNTKKDDVVFNQLFVNSKPYLGNLQLNQTEEIILDHDQNFITITYAVIDIRSNKRRNFRYRMEGIDHSWVESRMSNEATYTKLNPGEYIFKIQSTNEYGQWNKNIKSLKITILPPWHQTWWFRSLLALVILGIVFSLMKFYISYQKRNLENEKRFAQLETMILKSQMNPHFIFNSLNSIRYLFMKDQKDKGLKYITKFAKLLRSTLHHGEQALVPLSEELELTELYIDLEQLRFEDQFTLVKEYEGDEWKKIPIPPFVLQPIVENAFWHGLSRTSNPIKKLHLTIQYKSDFTTITIEDNGVGLDAPTINQASDLGKTKSFGLNLIQERFKLINTTQNRRYTIDMKKSELYEVGAKIVITITNN